MKTLIQHILGFFSQTILVLALLLGQQGSVLHSLGHVFAEKSQQQKKHSPTVECEQCVSYAQFSGTLNSAKIIHNFQSAFTEVFASTKLLPLSSLTTAAVARGPPYSQRTA